MAMQYTSPTQGVIPPPPGVQPDLFYNSPDGRTLAVTIPCIIISTIFVVGRIYTKLGVLGGPGWDDAWLVLGYVTSMTTFAMFLKATSLGYGHHLWDIQIGKSIDLAMWTSIAGLFYLVPVLFLKLSFFSSYLRIFQPHRSMRWLCWGGIAGCAICYITFFFVRIFSCNPAKKTFIIDLPGTCMPLKPQAIASGVVNSITDLYITILPMPFLWQLQMPWKKKLRVALAFGMGFFCTAVSLARLVATVVNFNSVDPYYDFWAISLWVYLEFTVGAIAASCLVMPAFVARVASPAISKVASYASSMKTRSGGSETAVSSHRSMNDNKSEEYHEHKRNMTIDKTTTVTVEREAMV